MEWSAARASSWLKIYADVVAKDAFKSGGDSLLYACAGAAYYAVIHEVGYNTQKEFCRFIKTHMGLNDDFVDYALDQIKNNNFYGD